jgi:hypothetical protein
MINCLEVFSIDDAQQGTQGGVFTPQTVLRYMKKIVCILLFGKRK